MTTFALAELIDKRAELAGEIIQAEKRVRELRADLGSRGGSHSHLRPGIELGKVVPRRIEFHPRYFKRGTLAKLILDYMRQHAGETVAVIHILPAAIGDHSLILLNISGLRSAFMRRCDGLNEES